MDVSDERDDDGLYLLLGIAGAEFEIFDQGVTLEDCNVEGDVRVARIPETFVNVCIDVGRTARLKNVGLQRLDLAEDVQHEFVREMCHVFACFLLVYYLQETCLSFHCRHVFLTFLFGEVLDLQHIVVFVNPLIT